MSKLGCVNINYGFVRVRVRVIYTTKMNCRSFPILHYPFICLLISKFAFFSERLLKLSVMLDQQSPQCAPAYCTLPMSSTAESKRRLLAKCNASRRKIVNFFRNLTKYRLKKGQNVQFMSKKGVHGTIVHLTSLHTWNLHGKV